MVVVYQYNISFGAVQFLSESIGAFSKAAKVAKVLSMEVDIASGEYDILLKVL